MKITELTFTRFLAAISIVVFHFSKEVFPFTLDSLRSFTIFLNVLVSYFFVLSGFILSINSKEGVGLRQFYFNRFSRIYPVYLTALLFTFLLILSIRPFNFSWDFHRILLSVFLVQSWTEKYALVFNYPAWSLSAEAFFYLLFPIVYRLLVRLTFQLRAIIIIVFWLVMQCVFIAMSLAKESHILYHPLFHVSTFLIGMLGGMLYREKHEWLLIQRKKIIHLFFILTILLSGLMLTENKLFRLVYHNGLLAPYFLLFIYIIAEKWFPFLNWFSKRQPEYLGEISYGIYILQVPVYRLLTQSFQLHSNFSATTFFYLYVGVLVVISVISYEVIEKPSRRYLRSRFC